MVSQNGEAVAVVLVVVGGSCVSAVALDVSALKGTRVEAVVMGEANVACAQVPHGEVRIEWNYRKPNRPQPDTGEP
ncbi:hypothetical protein RUM44_010047 [Polyplax serrata]|uniref:Uncharacterized protein n=1 Tax=Polyplax serrata TaxID=468196 RepID=A0ABR1AUE6_POLSC